MKPLREMLPDGRLERTQDFLRQLDAGRAVADRRAVIGDFRQNVREITAATANNVSGNNRATGGARQFGGGNGGGERSAEQLDVHRRRRGRAIHEQRDGRAFLQSHDDFDKRERVFTDNQGFNAAPRAGHLAQFR